MADSPEWFAPKRYGLGSGFPSPGRAGAVLAAYGLIVGGAIWAFEERPAAVAAIVAPTTLLLMAISARTTRGGWRWRWGKED